MFARGWRKLRHLKPPRTCADQAAWAVRRDAEALLLPVTRSGPKAVAVTHHGAAKCPGSPIRR